MQSDCDAAVRIEIAAPGNPWTDTTFSVMKYEKHGININDDYKTNKNEN